MRVIIVALTATAVMMASDTESDIANRAAQALQERDYRSACETLRSATSQFSASAILWNMRGICESELRQMPAAEAAFEHGLQIAPESVSLLQNFGLFEFRQSEYARAKRTLQRAVELGSSDPGVFFSLAAAKIRTGEEAAGLADLEALEPKLSNQGTYWTERGWVEMQLKRPGAGNSFDRALTLTPDDVRALNGAASVAEGQHNDEKALSLLLKAKNASPDDVTTLLHFGSVCLRRDLTVDAVSSLKRAHELAPSNNLALFLYARANIAIQHWQSAYDLFSQFDRRVPNYAPAQFALGWLDVKLNRRDEANGHLERSLKLDPTLVDARAELGQLDIDEGKVSDARHELYLVLKSRPLHTQANISMGDLLLRQGDLDGAKRHYETAIKSDPQSGPAHYKLSTVLMRQHETDAAEQERSLGAKLNSEADRSRKTVLLLAEPDGTLLSGSPHKLDDEAR